MFARAPVCRGTDFKGNIMAKSTRSRVGEFEKSLKELETIVEKMEAGDQSLETSLKDFERGMELARQCRDSLNKAELRVQELLEKADDAHDTSSEDEDS
jgi:exodeoxyribonuclease VII small subunit